MLLIYVFYFITRLGLPYETHSIKSNWFGNVKLHHIIISYVVIADKEVYRFFNA
jgi:hypothetical protein